MSITINIDDNEENNISTFVSTGNPMLSFMAMPNGENFKYLGALLYNKILHEIKSKNEPIAFDNLFVNKNMELGKLDLQPILFNKFFNKGEAIVLASKAGVGKSWLSIEIAKQPTVKRALFLTLEDYSERQLPRYIKSLSKKGIDGFEVITYKNWQKYYSSIMKAINDKINIRAYFDTQISKHYSKFISRRDCLEKQYGIKREHGLDNVLVFENIMDDLKNENFDFICIDSLNALLGHPNKISRRVIERIIAKTTEVDATLLIIHHINKKGEVSGTSELGNAVDTVCVLSTNKDDKNVFTLEETKARNKPDGAETTLIKKIKTDDFEVTYEQIGQVSKSKEESRDWYDDLSETQKNILFVFRDLGENELEKEVLEENLAERGFTPVSLDNFLKKLEKKNIIKAALKEGEKNRWKTVKLLKSFADDL